ncbi:hypothetical protein [Allobranchiibius sp. GilTou73]|uniref:hypothetical protein n=1 Tax=Allobranchiibius sp. GilTou73 TaxID=2904523 RepID=UPI001F2B22A3|nr:hypothetical protein [Allobranchiibius sp. GilTou73]UIJ34318.1 hypothetical protein LVQ62_14540 [Allobranchiibius sp. GilTou73]
MLAGAAVVAPAAHAGGTYEGCPYGAVCIYPQNAGWNGGHPEAGGVYWSYGAHNLSNQYGNHYVFNNQYGGARMAFNYGYNGTHRRSTMNAYTYVDLDLYPINSITLLRPGQ